MVGVGCDLTLRSLSTFGFALVPHRGPPMRAALALVLRAGCAS